MGSMDTVERGKGEPIGFVPAYADWMLFSSVVDV
jgi:hypothetical protein